MFRSPENLLVLVSLVNVVWAFGLESGTPIATWIERTYVHRAQRVGEVTGWLEQHDFQIDMILTENVGKLTGKSLVAEVTSFRLKMSTKSLSFIPIWAENSV